MVEEGTITHEDMKEKKKEYLKRKTTRKKRNLIKWINIWAVAFERYSCPVDWGCRIHRLLLCRRVRPPPTNECPRYDTKQSDHEVPAMLEFWGMWSTPSLPLLPGPLWPGVVAQDSALSMG